MNNKVCKGALLAAALLLWAAISYFLLVVISLSDFELDFSLENRLRTALGASAQNASPSLVQPMLYMLYGASGGILLLIILQFAGLFRRTPSVRWLTFTRILQVVIGLSAAILLGVIGGCLAAEQSSLVLPFVLSGLLAARLIGFMVQSLLAKR